MLQITVPEKEYWNEKTGEFLLIKQQVLNLEHSLVSITKWEEKWKKPFLTTYNNSMTDEEMRDYIKCMTLTQNVNDDVYYSLTAENIKDIYSYIDDPMTATTFSKDNGRPSREIITAELIYYWMIALNVPFECKKWHLNKLLTLIQVCNIKNAPPKKKRPADINSENERINEMRRKKINSKG